jgi:hypothetical protein
LTKTHLTTSSSPNNNLIFNSQSNLSTPLKITGRKSVITHKPQSIKKPTRPEPYSRQTQFDPNPSIPPVTINRIGLETQTRTVQLNHDCAENIETQAERKRRREEKNPCEKNVDETDQHFLSAGPGSQDCREQ